MRSARAPLFGTVLVWLAYAGFTALVPAAPQAAVSDAGSSAAVRSSGPNRAGDMSRVAAPRKVVPPHSVPVKEQPAAPAPTAPDAPSRPRLVVTPADAELLALRGDPDKPEDVAALEAFVAAHPDHALGRALLIGFMLAAGNDPALVRPHVEALRELMPESGLPDLYTAALAVREGRVDFARQAVIEAARKDLSWLPDSEFVRLKIAHGLQQGVPPFTVLGDGFANVRLPLLRLNRDLVNATLEQQDDGAAAPDPRLRVETARAFVEVGAAMQAHGAIMIENLVGCAVTKSALDALAETGALTDGDRALLRRVDAVRGEARLVGTYVESVLTAGRVEQYLQDLVAYGEMRAALRGYMGLYGEAEGEAHR